MDNAPERVPAPPPTMVGLRSTFPPPFTLFHPDGVIRNSLILGSNFPATADGGSSGGEADFILLAPTVEECRMPGWLEQAADRIASTLAADGLVYAVTPPRWRAKVLGLVRHHDLLPGAAYLHLPGWPSSQYLIPLKPAPLRYAMVNIFPTRPLARWIALGLVRSPYGAKIAARRLAWTGFIAQRPGSRVPFNWLASLVGEPAVPDSILLTVSGRKNRHSVVLHGFSKGSAPSIVVKAAGPASTENNPEEEFHNLERFGESARLAGARVPQPIRLARSGEDVLLVEEALAGRSAAALLAGRGGSVFAALNPILTWLERWNHGTRSLQPGACAFLEQAVLAPARELASRLPASDEYLARLAAACAAAPDPLPVVTAHNDLTLWNVLVEPGESIGIVDWREAAPAALPLTDPFYMLVDALRVARRVSPVEAFHACFSPQGPYHRLALKSVERFTRSLELPPVYANICLQACFLHHAVNEQRERDATEPHPFLEIAQALAQDPTYMEIFR